MFKKKNKYIDCPKINPDVVQIGKDNYKTYMFCNVSDYSKFPSESEMEERGIAKPDIVMAHIRSTKEIGVYNFDSENWKIYDCYMEHFHYYPAGIERQTLKPDSVQVVIDGLLYDVSESEKIVDYRISGKDVYLCGLPCYDCIGGELYRTKNGRFFVWKYNMVYPCSDNAVKNLLRYDIEKYQEIFGKVEKA